MQTTTAAQDAHIDLPLPSYSVANILKLKRKLESHPNLLDLQDSKLSGPLAERLHFRLLEILPNGVQEDALWATIEPYIGRELTESRWRRIMWRIAGNIRRLKEGRAVLPYRQQRAAEWVPMQVVGSKRVPARYGKAAARFQFRCLAGTPAGVLLAQTWRLSFCRVMANHTGFSKYAEGKYPYRHYSELVSLRLYGLFTPELCVKEPNFRKVRVPGGFLSWNRKIMSMRQRVDFECPKQYEHPCHHCHVGTDQCPAAVHATTYVFQKCEACGEEAAPFEPGPVMKMCVNCKTRRDMALD